MSENSKKPDSAAEQEPIAPKPLVPNATTIEAMKEARNLKGPGFATVEELMSDLKNDD